MAVGPATLGSTVGRSRSPVVGWFHHPIAKIKQTTTTATTPTMSKVGRGYELRALLIVEGENCQASPLKLTPQCSHFAARMGMSLLHRAQRTRVSFSACSRFAAKLMLIGSSSFIGVLSLTALVR